MKIKLNIIMHYVLLIPYFKFNCKAIFCLFNNVAVKTNIL